MEFMQTNISQGAETEKCEFRSTIATEKVLHLILVEKDLLFNARDSS